MAASPDPAIAFALLVELAAAVSGSEDGTVPVERARASVARRKELGMEHLYGEIAGGDHSLFISQSKEVVGTLFDFFNIVAKTH